jgi:hypothetical protein
MGDPDIASLIRATANNHRQRWVPAPYAQLRIWAGTTA